MHNKKTNWWVIIAILVIGVPVGYVSMGVIKKIANKDDIIVVDSIKKDVNEESMNSVDSINNEKEDTVNKPVQNPMSDVVQEKEPKDIKDKQQEIVRPKSSVDVNEESPSLKPTPKKFYTSVKPNSLAYTVNGGSKNINISSNTNWRVTIVEGDNWLRSSTINGNGNKTITFVAQESMVTSQRSATIDVKWTDENDNERTFQIKASQAAYVPAPEPVTVTEAQSIVADGRASARIPDICQVTGNNNIKSNYGSFRSNVDKYQKVTVTSVTADKKTGNATKIVVNVEPKKDPVIIIPVLSNDEAQAIVSSGKASSKISEGCKIVLNGKSTNYQDFRNGVKLGSYSGIEVTKVEDDGKTVNAVYVTAKVNSGDD